MTTFTLAPTEDDVFTALRAFLQDILPPQATSPEPIGFVVIVGQENRVPQPSETNFAVMQPLRMPRLSTNFEGLDDTGLVQIIQQATQAAIQVDVYGPEAFNNANRISTLFRSSYAVDFFSALNAAIAPLYADDPRQAMFEDGEQQYEDRYTIEANLQVNVTATAVTQSATALTLDVIESQTDPDSWPNSTITVTAATPIP